MLAIAFTFPPVCISADQRVFHQGAEEALPEEQRHGCLLFHLELCYDHSKSDRASPILTVVSGHQHVAQPTPSAVPGSACFNHPVVSSIAPGLVLEGRWDFGWQSVSQMELPVLRETLLVTASLSPDLPKPEALDLNGSPQFWNIRHREQRRCLQLGITAFALGLPPCSLLQNYSQPTAAKSWH